MNTPTIPEALTRTALALQVETLRRQVEALQLELATDPLTGVRSRRYLMHRLAQEADGAASPCAVILIDIDHFKRVNDTHGHPAGDAVLRAVAQTLAQGVRASDDVGRWGGEEFLVLCPNTDAAQVEALAERLRAGVEALECSVGRVTVSVGIAARNEPFGSLDDTIARADAALYAAKQGGRNRVAASATALAA
jgi:diguanylate cyclase (GGDEF)-like protein